MSGLVFSLTLRGELSHIVICTSNALDITFD